MKRTRWLSSVVGLMAIGTLVPSYLRVYRVEGSSDAPSFLVGDRILVSKAAYDIRLPYTDAVLVSHEQPQRGDVVMFRPPGEEYFVFKRVIGCPGDTISMRGPHLVINGAALQYERVDGSEFRAVTERNTLGSVIEEESGNGLPHLITHTPDRGAGLPSSGVRLAAGQYFLVGDNRDNSTDSRAYGAVPRASIRGKVIRRFRSDR